MPPSAKPDNSYDPDMQRSASKFNVVQEMSASWHSQKATFNKFIHADGVISVLHKPSRALTQFHTDMSESNAIEMKHHHTVLLSACSLHAMPLRLVQASE